MWMSEYHIIERGLLLAGGYIFFDKIIKPLI